MYIYIFYSLKHYIRGFSGDLVIKNPLANARDSGYRSSILASIRFPGGGNGNSL